MLGLNPGIDADISELFFKFFVIHGRKLRTGNCPVAFLKNSQLPGDRHGGIHMVAGNHDGANTRFPAFHNGVLHFGAYRIDHTAKTHKAQFLLQSSGLAVRRQSLPTAAGAGEHPQSVVCHFLVGAQNFLPVFLGHGHFLAGAKIFGTEAQHHIGGTFGILYDPVWGFMDRGHHFTQRIKRGFGPSGKGFFQLVLGQIQFIGPIDQSRFRRLSGDLSLLVDFGIGTKRHSGGKLPFVRAEILNYRHFVLR